jgi:cell division FtsZ-interacting protein ZapD
MLKELERHRGVLLGYRGNPHISEAALDEVIGQIDEAHQALNNQAGKAGQADGQRWLMSIRSRISIPAAPANSTCRPTTPGSSIRPKPAARTWPAGSTRCGR